MNCFPLRLHWIQFQILVIERIDWVRDERTQAGSETVKQPDQMKQTGFKGSTAVGK